MAQILFLENLLKLCKYNIITGDIVSFTQSSLFKELNPPNIIINFFYKAEVSRHGFALLKFRRCFSAMFSLNIAASLVFSLIA